MPAPTLTTTPTLQVKPSPLTKEAFGPFGTAIYSPLPRNLTTTPSLSSLPPHNPTPILVNQATSLKYSPISPLQNHYPGHCPSDQPSSARMSMFSCFPRHLRSHPATSSKVFDVRILERHPFTTQTFIPIDLSSQSTAGDQDEPCYLVIVAPTLKGQTASAMTPAGPTTIRDPPDLKNLRAFVARGGQAVTYGPGTWHAPMVVVGSRRVDFVVVQYVNGVDAEDCQEAAFGEGIEVVLGDRVAAKL
ncbi:ureidoglycolate hydrolase [Aspergillus coremiiformis]|uniref:Ureidoglycolate hydrolase n=1 Tax=Aspergillus coremiiformis TaxID=138285 RepID=A0A5N6Z911_9EURO|nr:ureidoglycolate hydrolase [Aspergillus coremiiformis]